MSTIAQATVASARQRRSRRPRASARARRSRAASLWIVARRRDARRASSRVNVVVLQLNMEFDGLSRERAQLRPTTRSSARGSRARRPTCGSRMPRRRSSVSRRQTPSRRPTSGSGRSERAAREPPDSPAASRRSASSSSSRSPVPPTCRAAQHDRFAKMAITQHRETIEVPAGRGTIYDRTGEPLAIGEQATTIYANPRNIVDAQRAAVVDRQDARARARTTLYPMLKDRSKGFVYVARKADPIKAEALSKRGDPGSRLLPGGAAHLSAGRRRLARARLRRHRQPRARRARALARQDARRAGPGSRRSSRIPSVARSTSSRRGPSGPGRT